MESEGKEHRTEADELPQSETERSNSASNELSNSDMKNRFESQQSPDQEALVALAKEANKKGGVTREEGKTLVDWGKEVSQEPGDAFDKSRGPEIHEKGKSGPHYHVGGENHIPMKNDSSESKDLEIKK